MKNTLSRIPARAMSDAAFSLAALGLIVYFAFVAFQGNHGLTRLAAVNEEIRDLEVTLAGLQLERAELENRTRRLSASYLDLDLLDERAREVLGLMRPDEILIR
ncbi:septum formation initiator family protein [Roseobacter sp. HKCCA0434]|uniref:FtsB family cell division protein n=1 Tax=Roseobacter sp. HKCCA0434 TaxID=3079297 RepID=UPI0029057DC8|nr:septum formation initiator family protein [Roseobacter sp. HKCCA0434]